MDGEVIGPVFRRKFTLARKCDIGVIHEHEYDHALFVAQGGVEVEFSYIKDGALVEGKREVFDHFVVKAGAKHRIKALADNTRYWCVFSHRNWEGIVTQEYMGNLAATH